VNGSKLARLRLAKGWSQQRLAVEAGVHAMTISTAERGAVEPLLTTIEAIARALDVPLVELLEPEPEEATA